MIGHSAAKSGFIPGGDLSALIARLEAAEAGSRELDVAIWKTFSADRIDRDLSLVRGTWPRGASEEEKNARRVGFLLANAPNFTTSLDAAIALAERLMPGCCPGVARNVHHQDWYSWIGSKDEEGCGDLGNGRGPTPALALCIAILRAIPTGYEANGVVSPNLNPKAQGEVG